MSTLDTDFVIVEILPRLPAKSLARFKCVSKSFKSSILSRNLLVLPAPSGRGLICYDLDSLDTATATFVWKKCSISVVGSFNGLLCILARNSGFNYIHVLNPLTRIYNHIKVSKFIGIEVNFGFGFDHLNLAYKIVAVSYNQDDVYNKFRITRVYSFNTNSWQTVESECTTDSMEVGRGGVLTRNNLLHWMYLSPSLRKHRIRCFDVCKMKWTDDVLLPRFYYYPNHSKNDLLEFGIFDDCLFSSFENHVDSCFDVWVMKKYGVQDSWVNLFSIPISKDLEGGVVPVASRESSGDILIRQRLSSRLLWYNRTNGEMSEVKCNGSPEFSSVEVYMCSRSTVDIPEGKLFRDSSEFPL